MVALTCSLLFFLGLIIYVIETFLYKPVIMVSSIEHGLTIDGVAAHSNDISRL